MRRGEWGRNWGCCAHSIFKSLRSISSGPSVCIYILSYNKDQGIKKLATNQLFTLSNWFTINQKKRDKIKPNKQENQCLSENCDIVCHSQTTTEMPHKQESQILATSNPSNFQLFWVHMMTPCNTFKASKPIWNLSAHKSPKPLYWPNPT